MKLYYSGGASSLAAHIALREAACTFVLERVSLRSHRTFGGIDFRTINPKGYVPALQLDGPGSPVLTENAAILQYIADLAPETKLAPPQGTFLRYRLQEWLSFISAELHKQFIPLFQPETPVLTEERSRSKIAERFSYIADALHDGPFLMGEVFTVADAYLFAILRWTERFDIDLKIWPNLVVYYERVFRRPAVQTAMAAEGLLETRRIHRSA